MTYITLEDLTYIECVALFEDTELQGIVTHRIWGRERVPRLWQNSTCGGRSLGGREPALNHREVKSGESWGRGGHGGQAQVILPLFAPKSLHVLKIQVALFNCAAWQEGLGQFGDPVGFKLSSGWPRLVQESGFWRVLVRDSKFLDLGRAIAISVLVQAGHYHIG